MRTEAEALGIKVYVGRLRELLAESDVTPTERARATGLAETAITRHLRAKTMPSRPLVEDIVRAVVSLRFEPADQIPRGLRDRLVTELCDLAGAAMLDLDPSGPDVRAGASPASRCGPERNDEGHPMRTEAGRHLVWEAAA